LKVWRERKTKRDRERMESEGGLERDWREPDRDLQTVGVSVVFQQNLFEEEKGSLVRDMLTHLNHSMPHALSIERLASFALLVSNHELHDLGLLEDGSIHDLLLDGQLDLQSQRVRFSPNPNSIDNFHF
jgi:hypothetical protein